MGVALNGVQIRPGTADYYDASSRRGFSRDSSSGWNLEGIGARDKLGMDQNNAHVDERGLYHYHGIPKVLVSDSSSSLMGYAADGFEIHYAGNQQSASYQLKSGTRPNGPGGRYDGTYNEDWEYVAGSGSLDQCNGGTLNGKFVYFATDTYPFYPRCLWGEASKDFMPSGGKADKAKRQTTQQNSQRNPGNGRSGSGPPQAALDACRSGREGSSCSFSPPGRNQKISGTCRNTPDGQSACVPAGRPPGGRP